MNNKNILLENLEKIHTTPAGIDRIRKNLDLDVDDIPSWCKDKIKAKDSHIYRQGKNWYVEVEYCKITINASSYTIITAHKMKSVVTKS